ncbi:MAG TPA: hypothetical protein VF269_05115 [Rhodanobacteraceae bacterium]
MLIVRVVLCLSMMFCCALAQASITLTAKRISHGGTTLRQLHVSIEHGPEGHLTLQLKAASVDMPTLGWRHVGLDLDGVVTRMGNRHWQFDGNIALTGAPGGLFSRSHVSMVVDADADNIGIVITQQSIKVNAALPLDQPTHARIQLQHLPLAWLQGLLARAWSGRITGGQLDGVVALDIENGGVRSSGDIQLSKGGFDASNGTLAGQDLAARGRVTLDTSGGHDAINTDLILQGGQLLLGPLYTAFPDHGVHVSMRALVQGSDIDLRELRFTDPGTLQLVGAMNLGIDGHVRAIHLSRFSASLPSAYQRYGKAWLATLGFDHLLTSGQVSGYLWMDAHGLRAFGLQSNQLGIRGARLSVNGLDGTLDWRRGGSLQATTLAWKALGFYNIALGPATSRWQSRGGALTLVAPLSVPVLGGQLHVRRLAWNPQSGKGQHLATSLAMTGIDVSQLCAAFGWPAFPGTLGGAIPGLRYVGDQIQLDGGLSLNVFGGYVAVTQLALQHPFGAAPVLAGDVRLRGLDLAAMTSVFDFGRITGKLDGSVQNLRLVDWQPVAFQASLSTTGDGGRISQRAVNNLTAVGGGGMASGLQGAVLKLFDSFGYRKIGLSCTLQGSVCHMQGIQPEEGGYLIVQGRGLPHLSVVGHQHEVSWPILVSRLKAAVHSGGPVVK